MDHEGPFGCVDLFAHFDTLGFIPGEQAMELVVTLAEISGRHGQREQFLGRAEAYAED